MFHLYVKISLITYILLKSYRATHFMVTLFDSVKLTTSRLKLLLFSKFSVNEFLQKLLGSDYNCNCLHPFDLTNVQGLG